MPSRHSHSPLRPKVGQVDTRYKTKLCKHWQKTGQCKFGDRCLFAHGDHELRARSGNAQGGGSTPSSPEMCSPEMGPAEPPPELRILHGAHAPLTNCPAPADTHARAPMWDQPGASHHGMAEAHRQGPHMSDMMALAARSSAMDARWRSHGAPLPPPPPPHVHILEQNQVAPPGMPLPPAQCQNQVVAPSMPPPGITQCPNPAVAPGMPPPGMGKVVPQRKSSFPSSLLPAQLLRVTSQEVLRQSVKRFHTLFMGPRNPVWAW